MTPTEWVYAIAAVASSAAAVLAWIAKIRWADEYTRAKDEVIKAKDAHIERLRDDYARLAEMTPATITEHYKNAKNAMVEIITNLDAQLAAAKAEAVEREKRLALLKADAEEVPRLREEKVALEAATQRLEAELTSLKGQVGQIPTINFDDVYSSSLQLNSFLQRQVQPNFRHFRVPADLRVTVVGAEGVASYRIQADEQAPASDESPE